MSGLNKYVKQETKIKRKYYYKKYLYTLFIYKYIVIEN